LLRPHQAVAPRTPVESKVAGIWAEILEVDRVGVEDTFFDLGGHSLLLPKLLLRLREAFGVELSIQAVLAAETVSGLAAMLAPAEPWQGGVQPVPACDLDLAAEVELDPDVRPHPLALMAQGDPSA